MLKICSARAVALRKAFQTGTFAGVGKEKVRTMPASQYLKSAFN